MFVHITSVAGIPVDYQMKDSEMPINAYYNIMRSFLKPENADDDSNDALLDLLSPDRLGLTMKIHGLHGNSEILDWELPLRDEDEDSPVREILNDFGKLAGSMTPECVISEDEADDEEVDGDHYATKACSDVMKYLIRDKCKFNFAPFDIGGGGVFQMNDRNRTVMSINDEGMTYQWTKAVKASDDVFAKMKKIRDMVKKYEDIPDSTHVSLELMSDDTFRLKANVFIPMEAALNEIEDKNMDLGGYFAFQLLMFTGSINGVYYEFGWK